MLKELGFSLEQVAEILADDLSAGELRAMLSLRQIETRIAQIETEGCLSSADVVVRAVPAQQLVSVRRTVGLFSEAGTIIENLRQAAESLWPKAGDLQLVVLAHGEQFEPDALDLEIGLTCAGDKRLALPRDGVFSQSDFPALARMAICVRSGLPEDSHLVTARVGAFLAMNGEALAGPGREVFLHLPPPGRMQEAVVEMQFPLKDS